MLNCDLKRYIKSIVKEQRQQIVTTRNSVKREILDQMPLNLSYAVIISGIRRAGKSTLLQQL